MLIVKAESLIFGIEAENNYAGNYDNCYKEFKYNILNKNDKSDYRAMIVGVEIFSRNCKIFLIIN